MSTIDTGVLVGRDRLIPPALDHDASFTAGFGDPALQLIR